MLTIHLLTVLYLSHFAYSENEIEEVHTENSIYVLNQKNFDQFINKYDLVLVEFYAPWCGHCKSFAPIYTEAAEELAKNDPVIPLAKVDATVETELANKYEINGYPMLRYFKSGQVYDYDADRSSKSIVKFMKNAQSPNWKPPKNHVLILTKENFTDIVQSSDYILVEFFAPWCGHCKSLAPEYAKAANVLAKNNPPIPLATVDATQESDLAKQYEVTGYPTLKLFRNGKVRDYNGPRYSDGIVDWMLKNRANAAKEINSKTELNKFRDPEKVLVFGLFQSVDDKLYSIFIDACNRVRDEIVSVFSFNDDLHKAYNTNPDNNVGTVLLLQAEYFASRYESDYIKYDLNDTSEPTVDRMVSFFENRMLPLVGEYKSITSTFYQKFSKEYLCFFFFTVDFTVHHRSATRMWLEKIADIAVNFQETIKFTVADDEKLSDKAKELRLDDSGEDINVGCINRDNVKYRMPPMDEFDSDHIQQFLKDMLQGNIFPLLKSAPIPKLSSSGIKSIVGDNYKGLVNDVTYDGVMLLYRSPCDACVNLRIVLQGMAAKLQDKPLYFYAMDLSLNELPPISGLETVDSRPSLYFVTSIEDTKGAMFKKKFIKFSGDLTVESDIRSFITKFGGFGKDEL